jgi:hypothetical protein
MQSLSIKGRTHGLRLHALFVSYRHAPMHPQVLLPVAPNVEVPEYIFERTAKELKAEVAALVSTVLLCHCCSWGWGWGMFHPRLRMGTPHNTVLTW